MRAYAVVLAVALGAMGLYVAAGAQGPQRAPRYLYDPTWPKPLPNTWKMGGVTTGAPHTDMLETTKRIRRVSPTELENVVTIHDPEYYARDWQARFVYTRRPDVRIEDYICGLEHRDISSVRQRVGAHLDLHGLRTVLLPALQVIHRPRAVGGP